MVGSGCFVLLIPKSYWLIMFHPIHVVIFYTSIKLEGMNIPKMSKTNCLVDDGDWTKRWWWLDQKQEQRLLPLSSKQLCVKGYNILSLLHPGRSHYDKGARRMVVTLYLQNRLQQYGSSKSGYHDFNCNAWMTNVKTHCSLPKNPLLRSPAPHGRSACKATWTTGSRCPTRRPRRMKRQWCCRRHTRRRPGEWDLSTWPHLSACITQPRKTLPKQEARLTESCYCLMAWRLWDATKLLTRTKPSVWSKQIALRHWLLRPGGSFSKCHSSIFNPTQVGRLHLQDVLGPKFGHLFEVLHCQATIWLIKW